MKEKEEEQEEEEEGRRWREGSKSARVLCYEHGSRFRGTGFRLAGCGKDVGRFHDS